MPFQLCLISLLLVVSTTQAAFNSILHRRPNLHSLTSSYGHHKMNQFATAVEDLQSIHYRDQEIPLHIKWDSLHRQLIKQLKGQVWMETSLNHRAQAAIDPGLRLNHRARDIWPLTFVNEHRVKNFRFSGSRSSRQNPQKQTTHLKQTMIEPSLNMNPYMPIYYPPPPPVSPTGFPPPPPADMPPLQGSREYNHQPRSTEETFNRPTTHLLHTYPTWPSEEYGVPDTNSNAMYGDNTPPSYNSEIQNIPTKSSSSSNIYNTDMPEQVTGFPKDYFQPPPDVTVRIQTPETSLDWNFPAEPMLTCELLLGKLFVLRASGVPIHIKLGAETTEDSETCVYMKKMLQTPDENLEWKITISDDIGQTLWDNKCLPGDSFYIRYGYHVVFEGLPPNNESQRSQDIFNPQTDEPLHDNSKLANFIPVPHIPYNKRTWTRNTSNAVQRSRAATRR